MWQITDNLFVGRYRDTVNLPLLRAHNIAAMLQLAERIEQPGIEVLYLDVEGKTVGRALRKCLI